MSDKGESSCQVSSSRRRERSESRSDSQDNTSMSMKVNVMYRGIVYRVRGIKILCSVITAVILLLVAIVGLGVWMLVSAYGEEKAELYTGVVNTSTSSLPQDFDGRGTLEDLSTVYSIDFNAPSIAMDELSVPVSIPSSHANENLGLYYEEEVHFGDSTSYDEEMPFNIYHDDAPFNEAIGHFQGVTPSKELRPSSRVPGPDPPFGLFNGMPDFGDSRESITTEYITSNGSSDGWISPADQHPLDSHVELSEYKPIAVSSPDDYHNDYDINLEGFVRNSNDETYIEGQEGSRPGFGIYGGSMPDNIPRDIDPTMIDPENPFPFPPSLPPPPTGVRSPGPRPGRRRNNQRQRPVFRRIPPGVRRGQPINSGTPQPPYYQQPLAPEYNSQHFMESQMHDQHFSQKQGIQSEKESDTSTDIKAHTKSIESSVTHPDHHSILQQYSKAGVEIPKGFTLPPGFTMPDNLSDIETDADRRKPSPKGSYFEDMMHYYNKHERQSNPSSTTAVAGEGEYSERLGLSVQTDEGQTNESLQGQNFNGNRRQNTSDGVFNHFWNIYHGERQPPALHEDRGPVPEDDLLQPIRSSHGIPNPNVRGPRPNGQGYPIQIRPDAENPDRILMVNPSHPPRQQQISRRPNSPVPKVPQQHRPLLGPLHDMYQYSQRLVSSLLNFPGNLLSQVEDSRAEHMENEVQLLEDYNKVFEQHNLTSADILPDMFDGRPNRNERLMILDTEKIKSLNPFELSLITWTFLDFWEFLIEKVGTLSKEDLRHLELRLEALKRQKDHRMAKNIVAFTVDHITKDSNQGKAHAVEIASARLLDEMQQFDESEDVSAEVVRGRMWDPLGIFSSEQRVKFMQFAMKVIFRFGSVYLKRPYALDCMMLLFCKDLNTDSKKDGMDGMSAKVKSVGLKVLTEREDRQMDTMGEVWRALTAWETLQCESMFPRCDGPKALEIVNEVAVGAGK